jgi:hypothetical protein
MAWNQHAYNRGFADAEEILASEPDIRDSTALLRQAYRDLPDDLAVSEFEVGFCDAAARQSIHLR